MHESGVTPARARRPSPPTRRFARLAPFPTTPERTSRFPRRAASASDAADENTSDASSSSSRAASTSAERDAVRVESLTVAQLKAVLRSRGARLGGNKSELAARVAKGGAVTADALVASAEASAQKKNVRAPARRRPSAPRERPKPVLAWEVTDPPLPPRAPPLASDVPALRVVSWNVNGIRALLAKDPDILDRVAREENADVFVLQETKIQTKQVDEIDARVLAMYPHRVWNCSTARLGYSGTALFSREAPLRTWTDPFVSSTSGEDATAAAAFRDEGRVVVAEFPRVFVVGAYVPNSGAELKRLAPRINAWDPSAARYLRALEAKKPVVYCGDLNVAARDIDLWGNHRANQKSAGFTPEERDAFARYYVGAVGDEADGDGDELEPKPKPFVDTFRAAHPNAAAYSWFSYRGGARRANRGWRIDYILASDTPELVVHDAYIRGDVGGSDHCPVGVVLRVAKEEAGEAKKEKKSKTGRVQRGAYER